MITAFIATTVTVYNYYGKTNDDNITTFIAVIFTIHILQF